MRDAMFDLEAAKLGHMITGELGRLVACSCGWELPYDDSSRTLPFPSQEAWQGHVIEAAYEATRQHTTAP